MVVSPRVYQDGRGTLASRNSQARALACVCTCACVFMHTCGGEPWRRLC